MKFLSQIFSFLKNKYIVAFAVFTFVMLFFDQNNIFIQIDRKAQLNALQEKKKFYEDEIAKTQMELANLQNNPAAIEKYARENFYMKKPNEDLFIVVPATNSTK